MRRAAEIGIVVAALVIAPLAVALVARSERSANAAPAALAEVQRIVGTTSVGGVRLRLSHCTWSSDRSRISCLATGPGTGVCTFTATGGGSCRGGGGESSWWLLIGSDHRR